MWGRRGGGVRKRERGGEGEGRARLDRRERKKKTGMKKRGGGNIYGTIMK